MAYTKTTWVNDSAPALDADNLNKIEQGIYDADTLATALQNYINKNIQAGTTTTTVTAPANGYVDGSVTYDTPMDSTATVVATLYSASTAGAIGSLSISILSQTKNGFTYRVFNAGSTARTPSIRWIAVAK